MASMSYCLFENTASERDRCVEVMQEADSLADLVSDMSEHEERAFYEMFRIARDFLAQHERLLNAEALSE